MEIGTLPRIAALVLGALTLTAAAVSLARRETPAGVEVQFGGDGDRIPSAAAEPHATDPLRAGQRRCQQLGEAAASNVECLRIWAESRDRFLERSTEEGQ